jgi:hypothetical protein
LVKNVKEARILISFIRFDADVSRVFFLFCASPNFRGWFFCNRGRFSSPYASFEALSLALFARPLFSLWAQFSLLTM